MSIVKGAKTITQISPQQIVVIKQTDDNTSSDKKHTVLLKQVQRPQTQHRLTLANIQKGQRPIQSDQQAHVVNAEINHKNDVVISSESIENISKQDLLEKHQKQLQQLLVKHQNELKLQQNGTKEVQNITMQQSKTLPKQMIVIKQNQGQIVAETQNVEEETNSQSQKQVTSPLVILNKQQYQQQLQNPKHQIIQLSGQQLSTQQIQQVLLKQQHVLKRANQQQQTQQQQQQIVMLKPEIQQGQQQIVMLKQQTSQPQQQLVMIKQTTQQTQKVQPKQSQSQIIQIANSAGIMTPISTDLTKVIVF